MSLILTAIVLVGVVVSGFCLAMSAAKNQLPEAQAPTGYTETGQPIYRVAGYMSDGRPYSRRMNSLAVVALVLGFVIAPLAIPVGHVSRAQIRATGEQGSGMALAGLVLGYLSLVGIAVLAAVFAANA